jgi:hypothetical protein
LNLHPKVGQLGNLGFIEVLLDELVPHDLDSGLSRELLELPAPWNAFRRQAPRHGIRDGDPLPELDAEQLREARQRWQQWGPSTYQMEVQVSGRQAATYELEVVDHEVISALHNGRPLRRRRAFDAWSVPGMFDTIEADLRMQQRVQSHPDPETSELRLQCKFDPHYGYPARYRRTEFRRQGPNFVVSWEVTAFERPETPVHVN